jgi:phosphoribosyl 1,2-cyclic phosphate phosphodiesterase
MGKSATVTILGSGAAGGVPMVSVGWGRCNPDQPKNRRKRPSIMVSYDVDTPDQSPAHILIDTSPDLREQLLSTKVQALKSVLYTHAHADHSHGIDDLREINRAMGTGLAVYGADKHLQDLIERFAYVFADLNANAKSIYKPVLEPHALHIGSESAAAKVAMFQPYENSAEVVAFHQDHGFSMTVGYRFGKFAYSTDVVNLSQESIDALKGISVWVVGCLLDVPHQTHAHIDLVRQWADIIQPDHVILTHMSPRLDYDTLRETLPAYIQPAYDGMTFEVSDTGTFKQRADWYLATIS